MKKETGRDLKNLAKEISYTLWGRKEGTAIRLYNQPHLLLYNSDTDGWCVPIGFLNPGKSTLDIWLCRFTGYEERMIWYGFYSTSPQPIKRIAKYAAKYVGEPKELKDRDVVDISPNIGQMREQLQRRNFGRPFLEQYKEAGTYFYGIYDYGGMPSSLRERGRVIERAAEFFETIVRGLPSAKPSDDDRKIYPAIENRRIVTSHLRRERSGHLPNLRKHLDNFQCQICRMRFEDFYGPIGRDFAEAHHIVPLSKLDKITTTNIDDLITVCANCHRMLHRLEGNAGDIQKLKNAIKRSR